MNIIKKANPSPEEQQQLEALCQAVSKALDRKRRLGQYYVVWEDGRPVLKGEDAPVLKGGDTPDPDPQAKGRP